MPTVPDPLGVLGRSASLARMGLESLEEAERQARNLVLGPTMDEEADEGEESVRPPVQAGRRTVRSRLDQLLGRALEQSTSGAKQAYFHRVLDHMVPDEARMLSALSDGSSYPLVHVFARSRSGLSGDLLLGNACLAGRMANVTLPQLTPLYVANLLAWGLVQIGPEDPALKDDYLILMADNAVLKAVKAGSIGPIAPRVERHTLSISALGAELWQAATGEPR